MTVPTWPVDLPRPQRRGFQGQLVDPRSKRKADTGIPGYRRRWSQTARDIQMTLKVTRSQKAVFDRFLEETIDMGAIAFYMPDPTTDGWQFLTADGQPFLTSEGAPVLLAAQWLCMLGDEMPQERIEGIRTVISFSIVVLP